MNGNGYDAAGEDAALHARLGAVEHREILLAGAVTRFSHELADLRDEIVALRGDVRAGFERLTELLEER